MSSAPLSATYHRVRRKKSHNVAVTALARKLTVLHQCATLSGHQPIPHPLEGPVDGCR